jgi:hypothetical protein
MLANVKMMANSAVSSSDVVPFTILASLFRPSTHSLFNSPLLYSPTYPYEAVQPGSPRL